MIDNNLINNKLHEMEISLTKLNDSLNNTTQSTIKLSNVVADLFERHIKLSEVVATTKARVWATMGSVLVLSGGFVYVFQDKMNQITNMQTEVHALRTDVEVIKQDLRDLQK